MSRVAIIGAGLAGLVLAQALQGFAAVKVFEKSRGLGGRMATRRQNGFQFDHGAQFFTAKTEAFQGFLEPWLSAGVVARWDARFVEFDRNRINLRRTWAEEPAHYVGVPGMSALAGALAETLDVQTETRVHSIEGDSGAWRLRDSKGGDLGEFDWVVSSIPAAQAAPLLPHSFAHQQAVARSNMLGCYALMLGFDSPLPFDWDAALVRQADISWISVDSRKPGRSGNTLLVQATNRWAEANIERADSEVMAHMLAETANVTGFDPGSARHAVLHRWRYANTPKQHDAPAFVDLSRKLAACGDWCIHGRVEAAYLSGMDAARSIKATL